MAEAVLHDAQATLSTTGSSMAQVLFAETQWIGSKEANPSESPLEMPEELRTPIIRKSAIGAGHAAHRGWLEPLEVTVSSG